MILYAWTFCPFCKKVIKFIQENNIQNVDIEYIGNDEASRKLIIDKVGKCQVPLLEDNGKFILESDVIIETLKNK